MRFRQSLRLSWRAIANHKLRSSLTSLGVIIGVAAVITFAVLGGAFAASFVADFEDLTDAPALMVQTETPVEGGIGIMYSQSPIYTEHDVAQLEAIEGVEFVAPIGPISTVQASHGDTRLTGQVDVSATTAAGFGYDTFESGEAFTDGANEAVLNTQASQRFGGVEIGDTVTFTRDNGERTSVTVTGIIVEEVFAIPPTIYVPVDPFYANAVETDRGTTEFGYPFLWIGAEGIDELASVQTDVEAYLNGDSDALALKAEGDTIAVQTVDDLVGQITEMLDQLTVFIMAIAAIALIVGTIGIANIMIVSVVERTREIGIMKAVGARNRDILQLFLVESTALGVLGATAGVALGIGVGALGVLLLDWPMVYPIGWIIGSVVVGIGAGVLAGLYPAWRAASVDPIDALRAE